MSKQRKIAITMGEPGGVGPEVIARALSSGQLGDDCIPVVIGNQKVMEEAIGLTEVKLELKPVSRFEETGVSPGIVEIIEVPSPLPSEKCISTAEAGRAIVAYIQKAVEMALAGEVDAIVTGPISKESLMMAGYAWPGHTEMLAELTRADEYAMMFSSDKLRLMLCTIHIAMKEVPGRISEELVLRTIKLAQRGAGMLGIEKPRIAVAGLNPHAGEAGIMGEEEVRFIAPAVERAVAGGLDVSGPYPPDVVFHRALHSHFDMVVCMYHDQGLIPFKMLSFDTGVNVTVGLPIIRTSPDHGTGFDIAWKNLASPSSMIEAIKLAANMRL